MLRISSCHVYSSGLWARQHQARYEARQRAGLALHPTPLGAAEIGVGMAPEIVACVGEAVNAVSHRC
jgi:hypothetical protein